MTEAGKGVLAMIAASTVWGLSPLFYKLLADIPPLEVLSYRCLWSFAFFVVVLGVQRRLPLLTRSLGDWRMLGAIGLAAILISANWFGFIFAIGDGQAVEASLGYFIYPLVAVVLGRLAFGELLAGAQWVAIVLAAAGVMALAVGLHATPWIALVLATTFAGYGVLKKRMALGPVLSVTAETAILSPAAILWIALAGTGAGGGNDPLTHLLLMLSGPMTAIPLILFSYASRRVRMGSVGLLQYWNPTLQFLCATLIFMEPFTGWHVVSFGLIWLALAIFGVAAFRQDRAARRQASTAAMSGATVM